jgi:steroid delta-isomerase-like uncharacterized protein
MSAESNKALASRVLLEAFGQGKMAVLNEVIAPDHVDSGPAALPGMPNGPEGTKMLIGVYRTAFPDIHFKIEAQIAEGDTVVTRWSSGGTHKGVLAGIPATGKSASVTGVTIDRIANGKIVHSWAIFDQMGMMQQLGIIPMPGQSAH